MNTKGDRKSEACRTGAASCLNAKSAYKLRIRMLRNNTVTRARYASDARYYSAGGIDSLKLMKIQDDTCDTMSSIAAPYDVQLQMCLTTNQPTLNEVIRMDDDRLQPDVIIEAAI